MNKLYRSQDLEPGMLARILKLVIHNSCLLGYAMNPFLRLGAGTPEE
jgi:hypothetical protein